MTFTYLFAGVAHFTHFQYFIKLIPPFFPNPPAWVTFTGILDIGFSLFLPLEATRRWACYGLMIFVGGTLLVDSYIVLQGGMGIPLPFWDHTCG